MPRTEGAVAWPPPPPVPQQQRTVARTPPRPAWSPTYAPAWPPQPQPPRHPLAVWPSPPEADPPTRSLLVLVLAAAIVVVLSGGVAKLATGSSVPAAVSEFSASSGRTPVVWDNAFLSPPTNNAPPAVLSARVVLPTVGIDAAVGTSSDRSGPSRWR